MTKQMRKLRFRRLMVEGLEQRAMLAGNVTASVSGQTLFIRGNDLGNGVVITQTGATSFLVSGIPDLSTATPTTVNGGAAFAANNVRNFEIDLAGGNDVLGIGNNTAFLAELAAEAGGGATPAAGVAANAVNLRGYANIRTGAGDDAVGTQLTTTSGVLIQTGAGADAVAVEAASEGVLTVQTDSGDQRVDRADFVRVRGVTVSGAVSITTLAGDDAVQLDTVSAGYIGVNTGVGATIANVTDHDSVFGTAVTSRSAVDIISLVGDDENFLELTTANSVLIDLGLGDDFADISNSTLRTATILGQAGNDHIDLFGGAASRISVNLFIDGGEGNDGIHLFDQDIGAATLLAGNGNDGLFVSSSRVRNNLLIDMGAGDDNATRGTLFGLGSGLTLSSVIVDRVLTAFLGLGSDSATATGVTAGVGSAIFGGPGTDTYVDGGGNSSNIKRYEFP